MLVEAAHNSVAVAHALQPSEVDCFVLRRGFTPFNTSCLSRAILSLRYNADEEAVSEPFPSTHASTKT